jgi:hypothetical protein
MSSLRATVVGAGGGFEGERVACSDPTHPPPAAIELHPRMTSYDGQGRGTVC